MIAPKILKDEIRDKLVESTFKLFAASHPFFRTGVKVLSTQDFTIILSLSTPNFFA
jgi:hypothetical protein